MQRTLAPLLLVCLAPNAWAHSGGQIGNGILSGLAHPFLGMDHLFAMLAVGLWAALQGRWAVWMAPVGFVSGLSLGGSFGMLGLARTMPVEAVVQLSLVAMGLALVWGGRVALPVLVGIVGAFGIFHGLAHGREWVADHSPLAYGLGFVASSALLHFAGVIVGQAVISRTSGQHRISGMQFVGASVAGLGAAMLIGGS